MFWGEGYTVMLNLLPVLIIFLDHHLQNKAAMLQQIFHSGRATGFPKNVPYTVLLTYSFKPLPPRDFQFQ